MKVQNGLDLTGKVAIVTGGAGLLGPTFAEALSECGAKVILADINKAKGVRIARDLSQKTGGDVFYHPADVTDKRSVQSLISAVIKKFRKIHILVNGAVGSGKNFYAPVEKYSLDDWNHVMAVNVGGAFISSQAVGEVMKKQKEGSIINIASIYGLVGADQRIYGRSGINSPAVYAASKGAIINLTRYLSVYWASYGIRVNCISPGGVYNRQDKKFVKKYSSRTPMGRMLDKDELKGAVAFLASSNSSYVTGHNLVVDGGWTAW